MDIWLKKLRIEKNHYTFISNSDQEILVADVVIEISPRGSAYGKKLYCGEAKNSKGESHESRAH
ncbi:hypothetical protein KDA_63640 [Dictyobacter alpinus]|uniref:Uncharacterized protein n=1 Tax=Dictyobacter alpinus TaxID=2014873 RepID=A0A402BHU9_9CHLR|nr:hypothetical protein KDA_63640 [Dictyobacter alpinus]